VSRAGGILAVGIAVSAIGGGSVMASEEQAVASSGNGPPAAAPKVIPEPADVDVRRGKGFELERDTQIVVRDDSGDAVRVANQLADILRRSTGYPLPVVSRGKGSGHRIALELSGSPRLGREGYEVDANHGRVELRAGTPEGLFRGVQTLRQLLPARVESSSVQPGPWTIPAVEIADRPRYAWRGAMLDVARHFFSVAEVKRYIDQMALYKINTLHLHLADDQGWRIHIDSWPRLTEVGGSLEVGGTPGGFYTKADYREIVRYAADRFITIVPEIDTPGHTNAALASYAELNCDGVAPPLYTGTDVGFSSLCIDKEITYRFLDDVVREVAELTPGPYIHLGGDEAHSTTEEDYLQFMDRAESIVQAHGKKLMGWVEIAKSPLRSDTIGQFWRTADDAAGRDLAARAVAQGVKLVMSPADRIYIDMKYAPGLPEPRLGLSWAGFNGVADAYDWDPAAFVPEIGEEDVRGVEAPLWSETVTNSADIEIMAFPRLAGAAEVGWTPQERRSVADYLVRLGAHGPRWTAMGMNFFRSAEVPWE
jgi:hexosaminidase